jgi:ribosomal protein S18 acetylase RimI-like enzyme
MAQLFSTSKGDITIRIAVPDDSPTLLELRLEALSMHPEAFAADVDMTAAEGADVWAERIANYARRQSDAICIAECQNQIIGMAGVGLGHWPKTRHSGFIWGVYVTPDWRGMHIAEAILNECSGWAKDHGGVVVKLGVVTTNMSAIHCYTRCGFSVYGIEPKVIYHDGVYYDELSMVRLI